MLFCLSVQFAGGVQYVIQIAAGEFSVMVILIVFLYVKVDRAFTDISIAILQDLFHQLYLLDDVSRSVRMLGESTFNASIALW